jgi:hypothetical protein
MSHKIDGKHHRRLDVDLVEVEKKIAELVDEPPLTPKQAERLNEIILQIEVGRGAHVTLH